MAEYQFGYTGQQMNTLFGKIGPMETTVNDLNSKTLFFTNVQIPTSAWAADTTYSQYPYRATIAASGVTANHYCEVVFSLNDAVSGYFAPICESIANGIYIYATAIPLATITIPTIKATRAN